MSWTACWVRGPRCLCQTRGFTSRRATPARRSAASSDDRPQVRRAAHVVPGHPHLPLWADASPRPLVRARCCYCWRHRCRSCARLGCRLSFGNPLDDPLSGQPKKAATDDGHPRYENGYRCGRSRCCCCCHRRCCLVTWAGGVTRLQRLLRAGCPAHAQHRKMVRGHSTRGACAHRFAYRQLLTPVTQGARGLIAGRVHRPLCAHSASTGVPPCLGLFCQSPQRRLRTLRAVSAGMVPNAAPFPVERARPPI